MRYWKIAFVLGGVSGGSLLASESGSVDLLVGHFEVHVDYQAVGQGGDADEGWSNSVSFDRLGDFNNPDSSGIVRMPAEDVRFLVPPPTRTVASGSLNEFVGVGESVWILPQNQKPGQLFLGWRSVAPTGIFMTEVNGNFRPGALGSLASELISLSGSGPEAGGHFGMYTAGVFGGIEFHFNSADGLDEEDRLSPIPVGGHEHYNWVFSRPGSYQATFRVSGRLLSGEDTWAEQSYHFAVAFSGQVGAGDELRARDDDKWGLYSNSEGVEYSVDYAAVMAPLVEGEGATSYSVEIKWVDQELVAERRVGIAEADEVGSGGGLEGLELVSSVGPGEVSLSGPDDEGHYSFEFSEAGIYRVWLRRGGSGEGRAVVFLAGLPIDYNYAMWADSYERAHGLPVGSLGEVTGDFDGDGVPNGIEYLMFWHGLDPVVPDASNLPQPEYRNGAAELWYLRDLHKDDLGTTPLILAAAFSDSPAGPWLGWLPTGSGDQNTTESFPDDFYELGAELGNEIGPVVRRRLRVPGAASEIGFFRWELRQRQP